MFKGQQRSTVKKIDMISNLVSAQKLEILKILESSEEKPSQIAIKMNTSIQALTRHLDKLVETRYIEKTVDGKYKLTPIANVALLQIPFFEFLEKYKIHFTTHDFTGIPVHLVARLGELINCELEENLMKAIQRTRDFCIKPTKFFYGSTYTIPLEFYDVITKNLESGTNYKVVIGKNAVLPKGFHEYPSRKKFLKYSKSGQVQEKIVEHVPINVVVTETEAHLILANKEKGMPDGTAIFFSNDKKFRNWCLELFNYYWELPEIKNYKIKEI